MTSVKFTHFRPKDGKRWSHGPRAFVCDPGAIGTFILAPNNSGQWTDGQHWSIAQNDAGQWRLTPLQSDDEFGWTNGSGPCPTLDPEDWTPDDSEAAFCGETGS